MMFQRVRTLQGGSSNVVKTHFYTDGSFSCVPSKWYQKNSTSTNPSLKISWQSVQQVSKIAYS